MRLWFEKQSPVFWAFLGWFWYVLALFFAYISAQSDCNFFERFVVTDSFFGSICLCLALLSWSIGAYAVWYSKKPMQKKIIFILFTLSFLAVPFNAHDMSYYIGLGRGVAHGVNVYDSDWVFQNTLSCGGETQIMRGAMYGPIALYAFGVVASFSSSPLIFILVWKALMLFGLFVCVRGISRILPSLPSFNVWTFFALQPLVVWETLCSGHFDIWWVATVLWAVVYAKEGRWIFVAPLIALGTWIKFLPVFAAPWLFLWWWQSLKNKDSRSSVIYSFSTGIVIALCLTFVFWRHFWTGSHILTPIILQTKWAVSSIFAAIYYTLRPFADILLGSSAHWWLTRVVQGGLFGAMLFWLSPLISRLWRIVRFQESGSVQWFFSAITITFFVYASVWQKSFWPWYALWLLPLFFVITLCAPNFRAQRIGAYISAAPLLFYVVWLLGKMFGAEDPAGETWFFVVVVLLLWPIAWRELFFWRKEGYSTDL